MRSKTPLVLMEQLVMVLVFALAAALCLRVFAFSDQTSRRNEARDRAALEVQNVAETLKACRGDLEQAAERLEAVSSGQTLVLNFDEDWQKTSGEEQTVYQLNATEQESGQPLLGRAEIAVHTKAGSELFALNVAWQEVDSDG